MSLEIISSAFEHQGMIPSRYTCDGDDKSPQLSWQNVPSNTKSLVLIVDDPDAPMGTWVHWVLFNIPVDITELSEATSIPKGAVSGKNSWGKTGYGGPCPPSGMHRYFFTLYALDTPLNLDTSADKQAIQKAMQGHVLEDAELMGLYERVR